MLCFSNYNQRNVFIAIVDLKTRRKNIIKSLQTQLRPTFLYQVDESQMLVGTEGGIIEHWSIEDQTIMTVYEAHLGSL